ncbi:MAG: hypothetical protein ACRD2T_00350 [Thermoanaerobaculia bacterium]
MAEGRSEGASRFEELWGAGEKAVQERRLADAEGLFAQATAWAREHDENRNADAAQCALAAVVIQLGRGAAELPALRRILLKNADQANCRLAAYNISLHYERVKDYKKSLFYARIALDRSKLLGRADWLASSHNQAGNALLGESRIEEATAEYERALEFAPAGHNAIRAGIFGNLGYCRVLERRFAEGYRLLYESLALQRQFGTETHQVINRLDLCFAHLETGRYRHALRQGRVALRMAERLGQDELLKNALYLVGEAANLGGDLTGAQRTFARLQRDFFPGNPYLPSFLLAVDVRKLVNLHA